MVRSSFHKITGLLSMRERETDRETRTPQAAASNLAGSKAAAAGGAGAERATQTRSRNTTL